MTADDWDTLSDSDLWDGFTVYQHRDRDKLRALCCACARRAVERTKDTHPALPAVFDVVERYAARHASRSELLATRKVLRTAVAAMNQTMGRRRPIVSAIAELTDDTFEGFEHMLDRSAASLRNAMGKGFAAEKGALGRLVREIFGNPFRPLAFDPGWRTASVEALAAGVYAARTFDHLPVLADALEDAGCDAAELLAHLRGPGPHVRGCWALDLVLGKS